MQVIHNAWKHIRRSPYQSMVAILTMFLTMLLAGIFLLVTFGSSLVLQYFESKPQITVFFSNAATLTDADNLKKSLQSTGKVAAVKYVSKEDALAIYREQNKNDPLLLEMVTSDILPASLEVSALSPEFLHELEPVIKQTQGVEEVVFQKDVVDTLLKWTSAIRIIGIGLVSLFAVNSILIIMTVIGMKIAIKKDEIEILTLIGASPWYVRMPFVVEGGIYGLIGAFFSWMVITGLVVWIRTGILSFIGMIPVIQSVLSNPTSTAFFLAVGSLLGLLLVSGFLLGSIGSLVALGRYLRF